MKNLTSDDIHGQLGESPNKLYKNYVAWFKKTYSSEKKPLTFKAWLEWAIKREIVTNADGGTVQTLELKIREIQLSYVLIGAGLGAGVAAALKNKNVHWFAVGGALVGVILSFVFPKIKVESSGGGSSKSGGGSSGGGGSSPIASSPSLVSPVVVIPSVSRPSVPSKTSSGSQERAGGASAGSQGVDGGTGSGQGGAGSGSQGGAGGTGSANKGVAAPSGASPSTTSGTPLGGGRTVRMVAL